MSASPSNMLPIMFVKNWGDAFQHIPQIGYHQCVGHRGVGLLLLDSNLQKPHFDSGTFVRSRTEASMAASGFSEVYLTGHEFRIKLDTSHFKPEELQVEIVGIFVVVHGKHEERASDGEGTVAREFTRRYMLPEDCDSMAVVASWDPEGALVITAPIRKGVAVGRTVPIPPRSAQEAAETSAQEAVEEALKDLSDAYAMIPYKTAYTKKDFLKAEANATEKFRQAIEENPLEASMAFIEWADVDAFRFRPPFATEIIPAYSKEHVDVAALKASEKFCEANKLDTPEDMFASEVFMDWGNLIVDKLIKKSADKLSQAPPEKPADEG